MNESNHGGSRKGSGRPSKADELTLIKKIDKYIDTDVMLKKIVDIINNPDGRDSDKLRAIMLMMEYRWGKPKETKDITVFQEQPIFNFDL